MTFWIGFATGIFVMAFIGLVTGTTPEKAKQNLADWAALIWWYRN